jgi:DNA-binding Lrp family transcriptional regulator
MPNAIVYVLITVKHGKIETVATKLMKLNEVKEIHRLFGQYDIIIKLSAPSMNKVEYFVEKNLRKNKDIERTETLVVSDVL